MQLPIENQVPAHSDIASGLRIALVHDWLNGMRGGEKCLEVLCRAWPHAHLYTLIHQRGRLSPAIERMDIRTSFLQQLPGVFRHYRSLLPLMPLAIETFDLSGYDLVVSLSHCVAKSARVPRGVPHVCYCFTPMRYAWHMRTAYFDHAGASTLARARGRDVLRWPVVAARGLALGALRAWDRTTASRVTHFVAISSTVRSRIRECYGRSSRVIYPPVDIAFYQPAPLPREDFYLCVSAFAPYKRLDLAIQACQRLGRRLVIIGTGQDAARLQALAGPGVQMLGWQSDESIRAHYRRCRALLFPGVEDFGIVPLEAQACGTPVIAYADGGATETVIPPCGATPGTGLFFNEQSVEAMKGAICAFEANPACVDASKARAHAEQFATGRFARDLIDYCLGLAAADRLDELPPQRVAA